MPGKLTKEALAERDEKPGAINGEGKKRSEKTGVASKKE
jgi:hypothetical protein